MQASTIEHSSYPDRGSPVALDAPAIDKAVDLFGATLP